jgi:hypothetical protein
MMDLDKQKQYEDELLRVIGDKKIAFLNHSFAYTSFSSSTAYNYGLEKLETIKEAINKNRVSAKNYMLNKWIGGDNPTLQVAAYRLLSDSEEHRKLNQSYTDITTQGDKVGITPPIKWADEE